MSQIALESYSIDLPPPVMEVLDEFVQTRDDRVSDQMAEAGLEPTEIARLKTLWSMTSHCLAASDLRLMLEENGVQATTLMNKNAIELEHPIDQDLGIFTNRKSHVIVEAVTDQGKIYLDPFWQQFLEDTGLTIEDVHKNPDTHLLPDERILCYKADQIDDLSSWFAVIVRAIHDKARKGVLRAKTDMLTRRITLMDAFLNTANLTPAAEYYPIARLESIAQKIWNPGNYKEISDTEIEELAAANN